MRRLALRKRLFAIGAERYNICQQSLLHPTPIVRSGLLFLKKREVWIRKYVVNVEGSCLFGSTIKVGTIRMGFGANVGFVMLVKDTTNPPKRAK